MPPNQKFRMTHQRKMILEEIKKIHTHPTADEVYEIVRKRIPRISLGTVYRNLDILAKNGFIKKIDAGQGHPQMRFDAKTEDHYHITCMGCGSIEDLPLNSPDDALDNLTKTLLKATEYRIAGHNLDFFGLCPLCTQKGKSSFGAKMKEIE